MSVRTITNVRLFAYFSLLFLVLILFFIYRHPKGYGPKALPYKDFADDSTKEAEVNKSSRKQLGEPPSVIIAPHANFCDNYRYLIVIFTRVDKPEARRRFEATYGRFSKRHNFTYLFPVGLSKDEKVNIAVRKEHETYSHILQTNFIDSYRNLTLKSYSYTNYLRENCTNVRAVLKTDDDTVWNVTGTFKYLDEIDPDGNFIHCRALVCPRVEHQKGERWYMPYEEYPYEFYPSYCPSPFYAATPATFAKLCIATRTADHVWLDDVFSTGIIAKEAGVTFKYLPVNFDANTFEPLLNGSVLATYPFRKELDLALFYLTNVDVTKILGIEDLIRKCVPYEEYPYEFYPSYCPSPFYVATPAKFAKLCNATRAIGHVWSRTEMHVRAIANLRLIACFSLSFLVFMLFIIFRYPQRQVQKAQRFRLGEPPSVILAPHRGLCDNYRYLIVLFTRVEEPEARRRFEATYGRFSKRHNFTYLFPVGLSKDEKINMAVREENEKYSHLLQTNFTDDYHNLTLKTYSYTNYVRKNCTNVKAVMKVDDDTVWNVKGMFKYLDEIDPDGNILYCNPVSFAGVGRAKDGRWYVPYEVYPHEHYPTYCPGQIFAATPATFVRLWEATSAVDHVWVDDAFSTGIVAKEAGVSYQYMPINQNNRTIEPYLNGSVLATYPKQTELDLVLFYLTNVDVTKIPGIENLI